MSWTCRRALLALALVLPPAAAGAQGLPRPQALRLEWGAGSAFGGGGFAEAGFGVAGLRGPTSVGLRSLTGERVGRAPCDTLGACGVERYRRLDVVLGRAWRVSGADVVVAAGPSVLVVERRRREASAPAPGVVGSVGVDLFPSQALGVGLRAFGVLNGVQPMAGASLSLVVRLAVRDDSTVQPAVPRRPLFPGGGTAAAPHWRVASTSGIGGGGGEAMATAAVDVQRVTGGRLVGGRLAAAVPASLCLFGCPDFELNGVVTLDAAFGPVQNGRRSGSVLTAGPSLVFVDRDEGADRVAPGFAVTAGADTYLWRGIGLGAEVAGNLNRVVPLWRFGLGLRFRLAR
jgi:hypothetical protein